VRQTVAERGSPLRRWLLHVLRLAVGVAALTWIVSTAQWDDAVDPATGVVTQGLRRALAEAAWVWFAVAIGGYGLATVAGVARFWALLRAQGARVRAGLVFQLTYVGLFFNLALPGQTGGDLVKMAWTARAIGDRASAVAATAVDRVVGLLCLTFVALVPTLLVIREPAYRAVALVCVGVLATGVGTITIYLLPPVRRAFARLQGSGRRVVQIVSALDTAVSGYRRQPRAVLLASVASVTGHLGVVGCMWALGEALGLPPVNYLVVAPAIMLASAIPVAPGGTGQAEAAFLYFMPVPASERPKVVALGLCYRFCVLLFGCLGGVVLAFARGGASPHAEPASSVDSVGDAPDSAAP